MKTFVVLAIIAAIAFFALRANKQQEAPVDTGANSAVGGTMPADSRYLCYIWNTEAGDSASLRMAITPDQQVSGSFAWEPAEKDSKRGEFEGVAGALDQKSMSRTADLWWRTSAEGMTATEQLFVKFGDGSAVAGFGEMKDRGDGTYVYANPSAIFYGPTLSQTDCGDEAVR